jgi:2-amino-4-hydroxy-6-hydroxymethyldihydropteridine diphosphokinase
VLSIGSNIGDRLAHLRSVVAGLGDALRQASGVYETDPWGGVEQQAFLNAIVIAEDSAVDAQGWLHRAQEFERAAHRVRAERWGPRSLDVDLITCSDAGAAVVSHDERLTLPHPRAHQRAFVLVPWLTVEPDATLLVNGASRAVADLVADLDAVELAGVRESDLVLR